MNADTDIAQTDSKPERSRPRGQVRRSFFLLPLDYLRECLDRIADGPRPYVALAVLPFSMTLAWFVYVPIHELLHAFGCVAAGGTVSKLEIQAMYGGGLLAGIFDFVVAESEYAGRLSGFDTHGSDWVYLSTVAAPYLLTVLLGVPALRLCAMRSRPFLFGPAVVVSLAPFYSVPGDYYEMGSILSTRVATWLTVGAGAEPVFAGVRSDDLVALIGDVSANPAALGLGGGSEIAVAYALIALSLVVAVLLAFATFSLGGIVARASIGSRFDD
jgi:hypothetical protein